MGTKEVEGQSNLEVQPVKQTRRAKQVTII